MAAQAAELMVGFAVKTTHERAAYRTNVTRSRSDVAPNSEVRRKSLAYLNAFLEVSQRRPLFLDFAELGNAGSPERFKWQVLVQPYEAVRQTETRRERYNDVQASCVKTAVQSNLKANVGFFFKLKLNDFALFQNTHIDFFLVLPIFITYFLSQFPKFCQ